MLTPAHFLTPNPNIGLPDLDNDDDEFNPDRNAAERLLDTWKKGLKLLNKFWQIWRNDYLLSKFRGENTTEAARKARTVSIFGQGW